MVVVRRDDNVFWCFYVEVWWKWITTSLIVNIPEKVSEEIQIKGRTARQGENGSYSMVLNTDYLKEVMMITNTEFKTMNNTLKHYSVLKKREKKICKNLPI